MTLIVNNQIMTKNMSKYDTIYFAIIKQCGSSLFLISLHTLFNCLNKGCTILQILWAVKLKLSTGLSNRHVDMAACLVLVAYMTNAFPWFSGFLQDLPLVLLPFPLVSP